MDVKLTFINRTESPVNRDFVFFQKNLAAVFDDLAVVWKVIADCGFDDRHPFSFPLAMGIGAQDSWGNPIGLGQLPAKCGELFRVLERPSGSVIELVGPASSPTQMQLRSDFTRGAVNAQIFRDGRRLAVNNLVPGQTAAFEFRPSLWVGAVTEMREGDLINSAILSTIDTELSLEGIASADIVATGGGRGREWQPIRFDLENVVRT